MTFDRSTGDDYDVWNTVFNAPLTSGKIETGYTYVLTYSFTKGIGKSEKSCTPFP